MELSCPVVAGQSVEVRLEEDASVDDGTTVGPEPDIDLLLDGVDSSSEEDNSSAVVAVIIGSKLATSPAAGIEILSVDGIGDAGDGNSTALTEDLDASTRVEFISDAVVLVDVPCGASERSSAALAKRSESATEEASPDAGVLVVVCGSSAALAISSILGISYVAEKGSPEVGVVNVACRSNSAALAVPSNLETLTVESKGSPEADVVDVA